MAPLTFPGLAPGLRPRACPESLRTRYYPKAVQSRDGTIRVFGHAGADNAYGQVDQSIGMDAFRLARE